jgi:hypothetical protein
MKSKIGTLFILLLFLFSVISCDKYKLSNKEAFDILNKSELSGSIGYIDVKIHQAETKLLEKGGFLKINVEDFVWYTLDITEKGEQYFLSKEGPKYFESYRFLLYNEKPDSITGIAIDQEKGTAIVRYATVVENTPIAECLSLTKKPETLEVTFKKFDTGWQIEIPSNKEE